MKHIRDHIKDHFGFYCFLLWATLFFGAWTYTYDTDTPAGTDAPSTIDDRIREVKDAIQERLAVEHVFALTGSEVSGANTGKHSAITCTSLASTGAISGTTISGSGNVAINTDKFTVTAASGNTLVAGTLDVTGAFESTGVATLADASLLKTSAAPTTDAMIANKKYVDDNIGSANWTPTAYAGGESVTYPNGMIMKCGYVAYSGLTQDITFAAAFTTGIVSANVIPKLNAVRTYSPIITALSTTKISIVVGEAFTGYYWQAWGY